MKVKIDNFHGIRPRMHPSLLGQGMATRAHNCRLKSGKLVPLRQPSTVARSRVYKEGGLERLSEATSLHAWKWRTMAAGVDINLFAFKGMTWMAEGNVADDDYDRVFFTGETGVSYVGADGVEVENVPAVFLHDRNGNSVVKHPLVKTAPSLGSVTRVTQLADGATVYYAAFFVSWYDMYGYESAISQPSDIQEFTNGAGFTFTVSGIPTYAKGLRFYVSRSGTEEGSDGINHIADYDLPTASDTYTTSEITINLEDAGEAEPGIEPIPADLQCMQYVPNGFYTGFSADTPKTVMFSDVGMPTSWPVDFRYDVKDNIVALAVTANSVYALTDGWPWVLSGTAPESMTAAKLAGPAACVSPRGVCVFRNAVYYVSHEGLMSIQNDATSGTVCVNVTQKIFTKEQWQAKNPSTCIMQQHDGALFLFFTCEDGTPDEGLVIDLTESEDAVTTHDEAARCACVDVTEDRMYFVRNLTER